MGFLFFRVMSIYGAPGNDKAVRFICIQCMIE